MKKIFVWITVVMLAFSVFAVNVSAWGGEEKQIGQMTAGELRSAIENDLDGDIAAKRTLYSKTYQDGDMFWDVYSLEPMHIETPAGAFVNNTPANALRYGTASITAGSTGFYSTAGANIKQKNPNNNYNNPDLYMTGRTGTTDGEYIRRGLMKFNLNGYYNSTLTAACLELYASDPSQSSSKYDIEAWYIKDAWNSTTVTWNTKPSTGTPKCSKGIVDTGSGLITITVTDIVQMWFTNSSNNNGIVVKHDAETSATSTNWEGYSNSGLRPFLLVGYQ